MTLQRLIQGRPVRAGLSAGNNFDGLHQSLINRKLSLAARAAEYAAEAWVSRSLTMGLRLETEGSKC